MASRFTIACLLLAMYKCGHGFGPKPGAYFLDESIYAGLDPEPNLKIGERV